MVAECVSISDVGEGELEPMPLFIESCTMHGFLVDQVVRHADRAVLELIGRALCQALPELKDLCVLIDRSMQPLDVRPDLCGFDLDGLQKCILLRIHQRLPQFCRPTFTSNRTPIPNGPPKPQARGEI